MNEEKEERRGFRVTDRRRFSESGEAREDEASQASPAPVESPPAAPAAPPPPVEDAAEEPVSFSTFVLGLSTQALLHLGEIPNPSTHALEPDLEAAKHVIDVDFCSFGPVKCRIGIQTPNACFQFAQFFGRHEVSLVDEDHVGKSNLIFGFRRVL